MVGTVRSVKGGGTGGREAGLAWDLQLLVIVRQRIYRGVHRFPSLSIGILAWFGYHSIKLEDVLHARIALDAVTIIEYKGNSSELIGRPTTLNSSSALNADHVIPTSSYATTALVRSRL